MSASIIQAHAPWLTEPYIMVEFAELEHDRRPVFGTVALTRDGVAGLARMLAALADTAEAVHAAQVAEYLATPPNGVRS